MKKTANILINHVNGDKTNESKILFKKISSRLMDAGFILPIKQLKISNIIISAGMTFSIPDTEGEEPLDILSICYKIIQFAAKNNLELTYDQVSPDGDDFDQLMGTINVYPRDNNQAAGAERLMAEFIDRSKNDFSIEGPRKENHEGRDQIRVMRYDVIENKTAELEAPPEMHLSNSNAIELLKMLIENGLTGQDLDDYGGEISISELRQVILNIENAPRGVEEHTREEEFSAGESQPTMIGFGLDTSKLWQYLNILSDMIDYAVQNGHQSISYG